MLAIQESKAESDLSRSPERAYWLKKLSGTLPDPINFGHGATSGNRTAPSIEYRFEVSQLHTSALLKLSKGSPLSLYVVLTAVLKVLLYKYAGDTDIIVLSPVYSDGALDSPGDLLPLRTAVNSASTFKDLLRSVKDTVIEAYSNQGLTLGELAGLVSLVHRPFSHVLIELDALHDTSGIDRNFGGVVFSFTLASGRLSCNLIHPGYTPEQAQRIAEQYLAALGCAIEHLDSAISGLDILAPSELRTLSQLNAATNVSDADHLSIPELFERQVAAFPDRIAASFEDSFITYRRLKEAAISLASRLRSSHIGPDSVVGLFADRSLHYLTAILGVFRAGAAYLPLDPAHPVERIAHVLRSSGSSAVVTTRSYREKLENVLVAGGLEASFQVICLEDAIEAPSTSIRREKVNDKSLAYVLYTSGSTGVPKGAMIELAGMRNHLFAKIQDLALTANDVIAQNAAQCFDISVWQFLAAPLVGGTVRILSDDCVRNPEALLNEVAASGITVLELVPSQLRSILDTLSVSDSAGWDYSSLRYVVATGEALPPDLCHAWLARFPKKTIVNAWGPTEASDDVTHFHITHLPSSAMTVPIGRSLPNTATYLLDRDLSPVPLDTPGEIYVGGVCVGRGYVADPQKTAAAFVPDPFSSEPGARLYKTGDLGCCTAGAHIEFFGRIDHQVKIRGHRIELGEIDIALQQHPSVREAAVMAREDKPGEKRLVAYVVSAPGTAIAVTDLRAFLQNKLPDYMLPSAIVTLPSLPRTSNGKLDRKSLPAPDSSRPELGRSFVPPVSNMEHTLARIWAEVLGVD